MSIEKRYFTSGLSIRSYAPLTSWIGITSTSAAILWLAQKSSISWVSAMPPMASRRTAALKIRLNAATVEGSPEPDQGEIAVEPKIEIGVDVVIGGDGIEDEIEAAGVLLHLFRVPGDNDFVSAQAHRVLLLFGEVVKTTTWAPNARANFTAM